MTLHPAPTLKPESITRLQHIVGATHVLTSPEDLIAYSYDGTWAESRPQVVVLPRKAEEIAEILKLANAERIPVSPRGMGSGLSGGSIPARAGIALALNRMDRILEIDPVNHLAIVEPGVITYTLQTEVEKFGLFYPPDPSSLKQSAIGGNVAENAGGARCLKYGVTSDYVMALQVVLPNGEIIRTGGKVVKNVTGYNLRQLFVGSEGTLGVVTEITLKLLPLPKYNSTAMAVYSDLPAAAISVTEIMASGLLPASIELLDQITLECVETHLHAGLPVEAAAILLFAVDGNYSEIVQKETVAIAEICRKNGAGDVRVATTAQESEKLWQARRAVSPALARRRPNKLGEDISIPRSAIPEMIRRVRAIAGKYTLLIPVFGHAGDGNLHPNILCDRRDTDEMHRVRLAAGEIFHAAIELGGTLSGEHGIGLLKKEFMEADLGKETLATMQRIKDALDPNGILNPGKVFPTGTSDW